MAAPRPEAGDGARRRATSCVVKLGGSLSDAATLPGWLDALGRLAGQVVLVPGGGPFADQVRAAQRRWGFDDRAAHRMALLAMEQYGVMLAALHPALRPARSGREIARLRRAGCVPVWLPCAMALGRPEIAESWDVTSDSLAAWLAARIGLRRLVLVKSAAVPEEAPAAALVERGLVDPVLPSLLRAGRVAAWCIGAGNVAAFAAALAAGRMAGSRIRLDG
jgi:aspartokinase-like uncharacterized kinase